MLAKVKSSVILGIDGYLVDVEVDIGQGLPSFSIVGLPDASVQEAKERVRAAIKNSGFDFPNKKIIVNLSPSDFRKEGLSLDLPIALGIIAATEQINIDHLDKFVVIGALSLDGEVRKVSGVLSIALSLRKAGLSSLILPKDNANEGLLVEDLNIFPAENLAKVVHIINNNTKPIVDKQKLDSFYQPKEYREDFSEVKGQSHAKRALEVAAAGGHNVLMIGPPGAGKSMLAKRLPTILPPLSFEEALEVTKIYSAANLLPQGELITNRPFRSPHHTISNAGMVGGGSIPQPGEVTLANYGVLFLDELPEFQRHVTEVLRQPVEDGCVTISRAKISLTYPAKFMLIAAMNPCFCGYFTDPVRKCTCSPNQVKKYLLKVSGPLLDRIDIHLNVPHIPTNQLLDYNEGEPSKQISQRVAKARKIQVERFLQDKIYCNAQMAPIMLKKYCVIEDGARKLIEQAINKLRLSARAYHRILKLARTIADLAGKEAIDVSHIAESIQYRSLDRNVWSC